MAVAGPTREGALFERLKEQTLDHPYCRELKRGALPLSKIVKYQSDTLWLITSFPEYVAALASRCPRYEHDFKSKLLKNAWEEHDHPQMMARFVGAAGGNPDPIVNGPEEAYEASWQMRAYRNWLENNAFHRPWLEAVSVFSIGVEYVVMPQILMTRRALEEQYGSQGIKVVAVNTLNVHGKTRRSARRGVVGKTADWKKAIVTLAPGQRLEGVFGGV